MELLRLGAPPEMLPLRRLRKRLRKRLRRTVHSPLRISRRRAGWCCGSKGGPRGRIGRNGADAVCRVPCARRQNASRGLDCAVVIVVLLPHFLCLSVCLVLSLRVSNPWEPERLFASVPRTVRTPLLLARGSVVPYQNAECTTRERICRASNTLEVGRLVEPTCLSRRSTRRRRGFSAWLHGCVAACVLLVQRPYLPMRKYSPLSAKNAS